MYFQENNREKNSKHAFNIQICIKNNTKVHVTIDVRLLFCIFLCHVS